MARLTMAAEGWTIAEALEQFRQAGVPVDEAGFRGLARAARRIGNLVPVGHKPPGPQGGRGEFLFEIGELQQLHRDNARWLIVRG